VIKLNGHYYLKDYEMRDAITDAREIFYLYKDHVGQILPKSLLRNACESSGIILKYLQEEHNR